MESGFQPYFTRPASAKGVDMRLSVIIVSYNVRFFLEQCLASVREAIRGPLRGEVEVIVADNASKDGSLYFLRPLFPGFIFIDNRENIGFARANNLALARALGDYVLFLNPDTLIPEDALQKALAFMDEHPSAGASGVHMIDGHGRFLPESKRGFPGPAASFFKMTGLASVFPRSRVFAAYYAGHAAVDKVQEVAILSGACMLIRKTVLDRTGGFDERFFMYAEDIDLSWRIRQAGFKNYYLADITIIHFKGESTRRDLRYVRQFYKAMHQFRDKYGAGRPGEWLLRTGIGLREAAAMGAALIRGSSVGVRGSKEKDRLAGGSRLQAGKKGPNPEPLTPNPSYVLLGQPADPDAVRAALNRAGGKESEQVSPGCTVVFCQGEGLSWKNIINAVGGEDPVRICLLHGRETHALVGSPAGGRPGQVIFLNA